jgi:hypothetical protein
MKLAKFVLGLLTVLSTMPSLSQADYYQPHRGYRYRVTYESWDSGFTSYYGYRESCHRQYTGYGVYQTCYDTAYFAPSSYVYVEELQMTGGYHRVRVFRDEAQTSLYATYYVYEQGPVRRVEYREFSYDSTFYTPYESSYYHGNRSVWNEFNWDVGFAEVMVGAATVGVGAAVMASSGGNPTAMAAGLLSASAGSLSVSAGMNQMHQSSLQAHLAHHRYHSGIDVR